MKRKALPLLTVTALSLLVLSGCAFARQAWNVVSDTVDHAIGTVENPATNTVTKVKDAFK